LIGAFAPFVVPQTIGADPASDRIRIDLAMIDVTVTDEISDDAWARSNVTRLAAAQALTGANSAVIFATGSIVGATLAPNISSATVPISVYVVGLAFGTLPTDAISRAYGRRAAFMIGTGCGVLTGILAAFAILHGSFVLFCCATFLGGLYGAVSQSYRFAAADGARSLSDLRTNAKPNGI
jgi:MFS family permease